MKKEKKNYNILKAFFLLLIMLSIIYLILFFEPYKISPVWNKTDDFCKENGHNGVQDVRGFVFWISYSEKSEILCLDNTVYDTFQFQEQPTKYKYTCLERNKWGECISSKEELIQKSKFITGNYNNWIESLKYGDY